MDTDVLVVGAGPTGLMLTHELRVAGVSAVVVDRLPERSELSRAGGVHPRTMEVLDQRGLLEPLLATGDYPVSPGHFAGRLFDPADHDSRLPGRFIPQTVVEDFLTDRLAGHGVGVRRAHELVGLAADEDGVTATLRHGSTTRTVRSAFLVAADGAHSTVRRLLGIAFPGRPGTDTALVADVRLRDTRPSRPAAAGQSHTTAADGSWAMQFPLGGDLRRLALGGPAHSLPREIPVTEEEIRAGLRTVYGPGVDLVEQRYTYRITNAARQVADYRHGRVFLAGDAAHIHLPIGGLGMNTGLQDAVNLGWKLAAAVHGWAPQGLLDSYQSERHPVAAGVLRIVQAQSLLMDWAGTGGPDVAATRELFDTLLQLPDTRRHLAARMAGLDIRYPMPGAPGHPLLGRRAPDLDLTGAQGPVRLHALLRAGRGLLLDPSGGSDLAAVARGWKDRVDRVPTSTATDALLIRPDGHVCWAAARPYPSEPLAGALRRWFGEG
ncbi:FAD-dependent monooxygenase [Kitasatospora sp. NBC_01302]|uniref:FAD-dependent monooxygenase n=1 Tax=Kitasatospora sp. NBC_01302 TaxID=2903575 RepID=UPI002E11D5D3|nr:FAD-dependent monooxygenase [Kitasatospora sp. NBC_01302]